MKENNDNSTNNGNIILIFPLKLYSLESYGRELQHMLKSTLLDNQYKVFYVKTDYNNTKTLL